MARAHRLCTVPGCSRLYKKKGLCYLHWKYLQIHGRVEGPPRFVYYSWEPVDAYISRRFCEPLTDAQVHTVVGLSTNTYKTWHANDLTDYQADYIAVKLGEHPSYFWPSWFDDGLLDKTYMV